MSSALSNRDFTEAEQKELARIQKLLNLAANNPNEAEAAAAASKANEGLLRLNLDVATLEGATAAKDGKREQLKVAGGFYKHQRSLWAAVAELNFCMYWMQKYTVEGIRKRYNAGLPPIKTQIRKSRHALVGRIVNTQATVVMAEYLQGAIDRILLDRLHGNTSQMYSDWAAGFRKGATSRVLEMLAEKRRAYLIKEKLDRMATEKAAREGGRVTTATGLTVAVYQDAEHDANIDFLYGDGTSAKWAAERAERAATRARRGAEHTAWAKANPEKAAKQEAEARKGRRGGGGRWRGGSTERINDSGYYAGYDAAASISIEQQVDAAPKARRLA